VTKAACARDTSPFLTYSKEKSSLLAETLRRQKEGRAGGETIGPVRRRAAYGPEIAGMDTAILENIRSGRHQRLAGRVRPCEDDVIGSRVEVGVGAILEEHQAVAMMGVAWRAGRCFRLREAMHAHRHGADHAWQEHEQHQQAENNFFHPLHHRTFAGAWQVVRTNLFPRLLYPCALSVSLGDLRHSRRLTPRTPGAYTCASACSSPAFHAWKQGERAEVERE
jgi:hypothetical protein